MKIRTNMQSMRANSNIRKTSNKATKTMEKLSSGYSINRASDNAAGLGISEKMRAKLASLSRDVDNAYEGIDLAQTAEGALNEMHEIFKRVLELAEQSANGTYNDEVDRPALQEEVDQLMEESDRIVEYTNFNGIFPLKIEGAERMKVPGTGNGADIAYKPHVDIIDGKILMNSGTGINSITCPYDAIVNTDWSAPDTESWFLRDNLIGATSVSSTLNEIGIYGGHNAWLTYGNYSGEHTSEANKLKNSLLNTADLTVTLSLSDDGSTQEWSLDDLPNGLKCYRTRSYTNTSDIDDTTFVHFIIGCDGYPVSDTDTATDENFYSEFHENGYPVVEIVVAANNDQITNLGGYGSFSSQIGLTDVTMPVPYNNYISYETNIDFAGKTGSNIIGASLTLDDGNLGKYQFVKSVSDATTGYTPVIISETDDADTIAHCLFEAIKSQSSGYYSGYDYHSSDEYPDDYADDIEVFEYYSTADDGFLNGDAYGHLGSKLMINRHYHYNADNADYQDSNIRSVKAEFTAPTGTNASNVQQAWTAPSVTKVDGTEGVVGDITVTASVPAETNGLSIADETSKWVDGRYIYDTFGESFFEIYDNEAGQEFKKALSEGDTSLTITRWWENDDVYSGYMSLSNTELPQGFKWYNGWPNLNRFPANGGGGLYIRNSNNENVAMLYYTLPEFTSRDRYLPDYTRPANGSTSTIVLTKTTTMEQQEAAAHTIIDFTGKTGAEMTGSACLIGNNGSLGKYQFVTDSSNVTEGYNPVVISASDSAEIMARKLADAVNSDAVSGLSNFTVTADGAQLFFKEKSIDGAKAIDVSFTEPPLSPALYPSVDRKDGTDSTPAKTHVNFANTKGEYLIGGYMAVSTEGGGSSFENYQFVSDAADVRGGYIPIVLADDDEPAVIAEKVRDTVQEHPVEGYDLTADNGTFAITEHTLEGKKGVIVNFALPLRDPAKEAEIDSNTEETIVNENKNIHIFVGDSNKDYNWIDIPTFDLHTKNLGLENLDVSTLENAADSMDKVKTAINRVSEVRGQYGAVINRLDHSINNLDETAQNEQASESTIRDADMAKEMTDMTKHNIMMQAGQAMLAQANALPQSILSLLQ